MHAIRITHRPSATFGSTAPEAVAPHTYFAGFRTRTGRRDRAIYGSSPEVKITNGQEGQRQVKTWATEAAATTNLHHLIARGWKGQVVTY